MGYDLTNEKGQGFRVGIGGWWRLLEIAHKRGGWQPMGVTPPAYFDDVEHQDKWDASDYISNGNQVVGAEDARNLADALERVLDDIPDILVRNVITPSSDVPPIDYWSGKGNKDYLREFIAFCRQGGFTIA